MVRRVAFLVTAVLLTACSACGNSGSRFPVWGKVLYDGRPAAGALVYFHPKAGTTSARGAVAQGVVGDDGTFTLAGPEGDGAPPGEYAVLVEWKQGAGTTPGRAPALTAPDRFHGRYLDPNSPLLTAEVKAAKNRLPPFELN
jgi:hypothetical protein